MNKKIRTEAVDFLFDAILSLKSREECYTFFEDVCTMKEITEISQRLEVARQLDKGKKYIGFQLSVVNFILHLLISHLSSSSQT